MNVHCASSGADLDAHRNRALIFSLIPHIARKLTLFMAIFIDRGLKLLNVSIKQAIFIYSLLDTVTVAGIYDLRRLQIKRCGRLGPRAVLALDCCPSLLLFSCFNVQLSGLPRSSEFQRYPSAALLA